MTQLLAGFDALRVKLTGKKHIVSLGALFLIFVIAALLPLRFIDNGGQNGSDSYAERVQLFAEYWHSGEENFTVEKITEPSVEQLEFCEKTFSALLAKCRVDKAKDTEVKMEGSEYVAVRSGAYELQLCRKWMQYSGDWNSWIDVCFDMNTGEVYYLYSNGECIFNSGEYANVAPGRANARELALYIADEMGAELYYFDEAADPAAASTAIYLFDGVPVKIEMSIVYYEGRLFDVRAVCVK